MCDIIYKENYKMEHNTTMQNNKKECRVDEIIRKK